MHFGVVQEFQGLKFTTDVRSDSNIAAIVGRNGAGKSRLLKAIADRKVEVFVDGAIVMPGEVRLVTLNELQPGLMFSFEATQHKEQRLQAIALYNSYKGKFLRDPQQSVAAIGSHPHSGRGLTNIVQVALAASRASAALGKDVNELDDADLGDYFSGAEFMAMGSLNVTGTIRAYVERVDRNKENDYRNQEYGEANRCFTDAEFRDRLP